MRPPYTQIATVPTLSRWARGWNLGEMSPRGNSIGRVLVQWFISTATTENSWKPQFVIINHDFCRLVVERINSDEIWRFSWLPMVGNDSVDHHQAALWICLSISIVNPRRFRSIFDAFAIPQASLTNGGFHQTSLINQWLIIISQLFCY